MSELSGLKVYTGSNVVLNAEICIVIMSLDSDFRVIDAIDSVFNDCKEVEVLVVNTGEGSLKDCLRNHMHSISLIETKERKYVGGARNLGIRFSRAPIVCFLAADCLVTKNWFYYRIEAHKFSMVVASALRPAPDKNGFISKASWASYSLLHFGRMPEIPETKANLFGASYNRIVFEEFGLFDENIQVGEDSHFNMSVISKYNITWMPKIITLHKYPVSFFEACSDQFKRGGRDFLYVNVMMKKGKLFVIIRNFRWLLFNVKTLFFSGVDRFNPNVINNFWLVLLLLFFNFLGVLFKKSEE